MAFGTSPGCVLRERVMGAMTMRCGASRAAMETGVNRVWCMALLLLVPTTYALANSLSIHPELDIFSTFGKEWPTSTSREPLFELPRQAVRWDWSRWLST